ncbi:tripartite tricarboxylate transporter substrate binding protein [Pigmentiphaga soli]|uniref:Tripartite tricarboxylate transporter substrate binding protein n=2 Tax=Pigmentiphaga soli TaxID=1007095 RepID=A0ABP8GT05_9BURK
MAATGAAALAQSAARYPSQPVTIVVPFAAGSAADGMTRLCAQELTRKLGQSFVVENIGGASGTIGTDKVARSAPDGYNLVIASGATVTVAPYLFPNLPYDPKRLVPVSTMGDSPIVVAVPAKSPIRSLAELVAAARAAPGKLSFGSGGSGSAAHIAAEVFQWKTGTRFTHVPYRGVAASVPDLAAGRLDALFVSYPAVRPMTQAGSIRVLAVASEKRSDMVGMQVPTAAEAGVKDYVQSAWNGLMGPAGLPDEIVSKLNAALNEILRDPAIVKRLAGMGMTPIPGTPAEFAKRIDDETGEMQALTKITNISAN